MPTQKQSRLAARLDESLALDPTTPEARRALYVAQKIRASGRSVKALAREAKTRAVELCERTLTNGLDPEIAVREGTIRALATLFGDDPDRIVSDLGLTGWRAALPLSTRPDARFLAVFAERVARDGRSNAAIARAIGVSPERLHTMLTHPTARLAERTVRALEEVFQVKAGEWVALAGYVDPSAVVPDPRHFGTIWDWIEAACVARHETQRHAAISMKLAPDTLREIVHDRIMPERPTLDRLAAYFGVERHELRVLRQTDPRRVAAGKKAAARMGPGHMRAQAERARSKRKLTDEQRHFAGRCAGASARRRNSSHTWRALTELGRRAIERKRNDGAPWFKSESTRSKAHEGARAGGLKGGPANLAKNGRAGLAFVSSLARIRRPIYRELRLGLDSGDLQTSERVRAAWELLQCIWQPLRGSTDSALLRRVVPRVGAELRQARNPRSAGLNPTLLADIPRALALVDLRDHQRLSPAEVCRKLGLAVRRSSSSGFDAGPAYWRLHELGRLITRTRRTHSPVTPSQAKTKLAQS